MKFDNTEIKKYKFHQNKSPILINDIDINKIVVFNKFSFGKQDFRYFIGHKDHKNVRPLCIFFPKMGAYRIDFDEIECLCFMIKEEKNFVKYMDIWEKVNNI